MSVRDYDLVIYHGGCADGWTGAWIAARALPDGAQLHAAYHGTPPPEVRGRRALIVDFSYPRDVLRQMVADATALTVLDHHKTAEQALAGFADECATAGLTQPLIVFVQQHSGAVLAWRHFHGYNPPPVLVQFVEDRDLWTWRLPHSREINAAIASYPKELLAWDNLDYLCRHSPALLVTEGAAILRYQRKVVEGHLQHARREVIAGHEVPVVNATTLASEIAGELAKGQPFAACWFRRDDGKRIYSLRSDEAGLDVSEVAKAMGGGGHRRAAGYEQED